MFTLSPGLKNESIYRCFCYSIILNFLVQKLQNVQGLIPSKPSDKLDLVQWPCILWLLHIGFF